MATSIAKRVKQLKYKPMQGDLLSHNDGTIIFCTSDCTVGTSFCGVVVHPGDRCPIGRYSTSWEACVFTLFTGSVTLTQD